MKVIGHSMLLHWIWIFLSLTARNRTNELERLFKKEHFSKMKVIGQFNLGFIIGKIGQDLFIVDQSARDHHRPLSFPAHRPYPPAAAAYDLYARANPRADGDLKKCSIEELPQFDCVWLWLLIFAVYQLKDRLASLAKRLQYYLKS